MVTLANGLSFISVCPSRSNAVILYLSLDVLVVYLCTQFVTLPSGRYQFAFNVNPRVGLNITRQDGIKYH